MKITKFQSFIFILTIFCSGGSAFAQNASNVNFGDDESSWANDGECDDSRFTGEGMASSFSESDVLHDASDCRDLYESGDIRLTSSVAISARLVNFGDDESSWANDGECDDSRFSGEGMASSFSESDVLHDASDCRDLYESGDITLTSSVAVSSTSVDFGDDESSWANDGECDDSRFSGEGMASSFSESDVLHDASDCRSLYLSGDITLISNFITSGDSIDFGDDESGWANDGECDDSRFTGEGMASSFSDSDILHDASDCQDLYLDGSITLVGSVVNAGMQVSDHRVEVGVLEKGDETLSAGEFFDSYELDAIAGQTATFSLRSDEFDTYLMIIAPDGESYSNDDYEDSPSHSLLNLDLIAGVYDVRVTSFSSGEAGSYTLEIDTQSNLSQSGAGQQLMQISEIGRLQGSDETLTSGEYVDRYNVQGYVGQSFTIRIESDDFDTYAILQVPDGESQENDDNGENSNSLIEFDIPESGEYTVLVTSYEPGETGDYELYIEQNEVVEELLTPQRDVIRLNLGEQISGSLSEGDRVLDEGEYQDLFVFNGVAGQRIQVDLLSTDFDTYLGFTTPSGDRFDNDDFEGSTTHSLVEMTLQESGEYTVFATSYTANEVGDYSLSLSTQGQSGRSSNQVSSSGAGRVFGIFAGIADYPGEGSDLSYTDQDAVRVRDALIQGAGMNGSDAITLLDSQATRQNVQSAIQDLSSRMGPDDTFVLFYSGHGNQVPRGNGFESADPDGKDETIELYDGALSDNELNTMLDQLDVRMALIVLDSCFSGGFSKDIISKPGRMGLFSSEEDVTSQVAAKFRAGGYLSYFFEEALLEDFADADGDGNLNAIELSQYLHERFRSDVKAFGDAQYVRTSGPQSGYQHLVVDRGGISPYDVLF